MAETVYDVSRAKFEGFGTHKLPIEVHVNELIEMTKIDCVLEEKGWKKDDENGAKMYEDSVKQTMTLYIIL